ncbi:MAG TPA: serine/threonine-protein kinase [Planctomycetota bacterium]
MADPSADDKLLGHMLMSSRLITREQLERGLQELRDGRGASLREILIAKGWVSADILDQANAASIAYPPPTAPTLPAAPAPTSPTVAAPTAETIGLSPTYVPPAPSRPAAPESEFPPEVREAAASNKSRFGKYILVRQLGAGGMAVVYKAWDTLLQHFVALKFIKTQDFGDEDETAAKEQISTFLAEARLTVKLNHPNIARVYELGQIDDRYYMSQFYIDGPTLHEVIHGTRQKSLETLFYGNPKKYIQIMRDISEAMGYAHALTPSVIHRDLKPSNIMLDTSGRAYVVDFGLAKELKVDAASLSGAVKGTPKYMAPEQAEGRSKDMDGRTDIWALGVILYEMLSGRAPFEDDNIHRLLSKIVGAEAPWPRHVVQSGTVKISPSTAGAISIPRELEIIAMKCIQKDRKHRYPTCKDLVDDLDRALKGEEISIPEHSLQLGRAVKRHALAIASALLLLAGVGGLFAWAPWSRPPAVVAPTPPPPVDAGVPDGRRAQIAEIRDAFLRNPSDATLGPLVALLAKIEPVLEATARQGVAEWFTSQASRVDVDVRALHARPDWMGLQDRGRALLADLAFLERAAERRDVLKLSPAADLAELSRRARDVADWKGTFTLVANLHPWAAVKIDVAGKARPLDASRQEDVTPLRADKLPVGELSLRFSRGDASKTLTVAAKELRHGAVVRVWGTLDKLEHAIE